MGVSYTLTLEWVLMALRRRRGWSLLLHLMYLIALIAYHVFDCLSLSCTCFILLESQNYILVWILNCSLVWIFNCITIILVWISNLHSLCMNLEIALYTLYKHYAFCITPQKVIPTQALMRLMSKDYTILHQLSTLP